MKLTKLQNFLKTQGIAAKRFKKLTAEERRLLARPEDYNIYQSELVYSPWLAEAEFVQMYAEVAPHSLASAARCWLLYSAILQTVPCEGEWWECGVYRGGTALMLRQLRDKNASGKIVRLFDSFSGMPATDAARDVHQEGDFAATSLEAVQTLVGLEAVEYHAGFIPQTFINLEVDRIAFAHVDLDLHDAIYESCQFIYPRLAVGGAILFDDYGFPSCPGAKRAIDSFFMNKPEFPIVLPTGQCLVWKLA